MVSEAPGKRRSVVLLTVATSASRGVADTRSAAPRVGRTPLSVLLAVIVMVPPSDPIATRFLVKLFPLCKVLPAALHMRLYKK
jgi:hypothetical protein